MITRCTDETNLSQHTGELHYTLYCSARLTPPPQRGTVPPVSLVAVCAGLMRQQLGAEEAAQVGTWSPLPTRVRLFNVQRGVLGTVLSAKSLLDSCL